MREHSCAMGKIKPGSCSALLIGSPTAKLGTQQNSVGSGLLLHCTNQSLGTIFEASQIDGSNGVIFYGENTNGQSGKSVETLPDMNGDGVGEIAIGTPGASKTYIIFGDYLNKSTSPTLTLSTPNFNGLIILGGAGESSGVSIMGVENLTGTGVNAVLVGTNRASPYNRAGAGSSYGVYADSIQWENNKLNVSAGGNHTFTTYDLNVSVPHHSQYTHYNITTALYGHFEHKTQPGTTITFFGQPDLENGNVIFICDKDSKLAPSYKVTASHNWAKTPISAANVTFSTQPLAIVFNKLDVVRGKTTQITPTMFAANDPDNPQHNPKIVVTISNRSNGFFSPGDSFTLEDVSSQRVSFTHDGSAYTPNYGVNFSFGGVSVGPSSPVINFTEPAITGNPQTTTTTVGNPDDDSVGIRVGGSVGASVFGLLLTLGAYFYKRHLDRKEFKKKREAVLKENTTEKKLNQEWKQARDPLIREILDGVNMVGFCGSVNENDISAHIRAVETLLLKLQTENVEMDPPLTIEQKKAVKRAGSLQEQQKKEEEFKTINRKYVENVIVTEVLKSAETFIGTKSACCPCLPGCQPVLKAAELDVLSNQYLVTAIKKRLAGSSLGADEELELEGVAITGREEKRDSTSETLAARASTAISELTQSTEGVAQNPVETNKVLSLGGRLSKSSHSETAGLPPLAIPRSGSKQRVG